MASREGINPLRPYYIPQSGLSPTPNVTQETAASTSSPQVFGSSARDLIPDIDYSDYLDSSPSVSGWCRDAINSSLARYGQVLIAQPFEVAKIILQVYVVSDNVEEDRRSNPGTGSSSYDSVHISHTLSNSRYSQLTEASIRNRNHLTMKALISLLPRQPHQARVHRDPESPGIVSLTAVATFEQMPKLQLRSMLWLSRTRAH